MKNKSAFSKKGHDRVVLEWTTPEYIHHEKDAPWYLGAGLFLAIILVLALLSGNWSMALAFVVFAGVYHYLHTNHPPKEIRILISEMGHKRGRNVFPF